MYLRKREIKKRTQPKTLPFFEENMLRWPWNLKTWWLFLLLVVPLLAFERAVDFAHKKPLLILYHNSAHHTSDAGPALLHPHVSTRSDTMAKRAFFVRCIIARLWIRNAYPFYFTLVQKRTFTSACPVFTSPSFFGPDFAPPCRSHPFACHQRRLRTLPTPKPKLKPAQSTSSSSRSKFPPLLSRHLEGLYQTVVNFFKGARSCSKTLTRPTYAVNTLPRPPPKTRPHLPWSHLRRPSLSPSASRPSPRPPPQPPPPLAHFSRNVTMQTVLPSKTAPMTHSMSRRFYGPCASAPAKLQQAASASPRLRPTTPAAPRNSDFPKSSSVRFNRQP